MMKNNNTKGYMILGILFALVSIIALVVSQMKTAAFWIAYAFTVIALAAQLGIWKVALGKEGTLKKQIPWSPSYSYRYYLFGRSTHRFCHCYICPYAPYLEHNRSVYNYYWYLRRVYDCFRSGARRN